MMAKSLGNILIHTSKSINSLTKLFSYMSVSKNNSILNYHSNFFWNKERYLHTSTTSFDTKESKKKIDELKRLEKPTEPVGLMQFFDYEKNWGAPKIKCGRAWKKEELRLKSNEDLHKLWYILIKERNMLKTMEHAYLEKYEPMPNPERIDKVEDSMENLEYVVRERNQSYYMLECGIHGERPTKFTTNQIGLTYFYKMTQHPIPRFMNTAFNKKHITYFDGNAVRKFRRFYFEKMFIQKRRMQNRRKSLVKLYFRRFPNVDIEALLDKFPEFTRETLEKWRAQNKRATPHAVLE